MLPFGTLIRLKRKDPTAVYLQISNQLINLIRKGIIVPGSKLPGSRELATILNVHRKTIVAAYEELFSQDWIETVPRRGVFVSTQLPEIKPKNFSTAVKGGAEAFHLNIYGNYSSSLSINSGSSSRVRVYVNDGYPDHRIAPVDFLLREYKSQLLAGMKRKMPAPPDPAGSLQLREQLSAFLATTRGLQSDTSKIMITRGAQMSVYLAASLLLKPGGVVLVGDPDYHLADRVFLQLGAKLQRVPVDENGMDVDWIGNYCKKKKPDLLYIIPHHHHPTTVTLSASRRMKLIELIRDYRFPVIEDDYDYDFHYSSSPILPLASAEHGGLVIYIGSLTKTLAPGFRVGYLVAPPEFIRSAAQFRRLIDIRGDHALEDAIAALFRSGNMQRHLKKSVKLYHGRRDIFSALLEERLSDFLEFKTPAGGLAFWIRWNQRYPIAEISKRAASLGLSMSDGSFYRTEKTDLNGSRVGFASMNEKEMKECVNIFSEIFQSW